MWRRTAGELFVRAGRGRTGLRGAGRGGAADGFPVEAVRGRIVAETLDLGQDDEYQSLFALGVPSVADHPPRLPLPLVSGSSRLGSRAPFFCVPPVAAVLWSI